MAAIPTPVSPARPERAWHAASTLTLGKLRFAEPRLAARARDRGAADTRQAALALSGIKPHGPPLRIPCDTFSLVIDVRQTDEYEQWFDSLKDRTARVRVDIRVRRLSLGNPGDVEPVGEGVCELRIDYGPGYRVYFIQQGSLFVLLLLGGDKSTQTRDIRKAKALARKYLEN